MVMMLAKININFIENEPFVEGGSPTLNYEQMCHRCQCIVGQRIK